MKTFNYVSGLPTPVQLNTIEGKDGRFYITPNGNSVPSVTTVLGYSKREVIQAWRKRVGEEEANKVSSKASSRGTRFHNLCEKYLTNKENLFEGVMPDLLQSFRDVVATLDEIDNIHYVEAPLFSEDLGIAGRTDIIGEFRGKLSVVDFKTSNREKDENWIRDYFLQGTAYALMYEELTGTPIEQIVIIISVDHSPTPQIFVKNKNDYIVELLEKIIDYKRNH
jgi:genome maintenance exonuclease 1